MFIGKWNKSVILTYLGLAFAITGIYLSCCVANGVTYGMICLMCAGVCDMFDGYVARKCKRDEEEKNFGVELDSLSDIVCFVILPIVMCISLGMNEWYHLIMYIAFGICGIARLAYFNIKMADNSKPIKFYTGLPVTATAAIFPLFYLIFKIFKLSHINICFSILIPLVAFLYIFNFKLRKPKGKEYAFLTAIAVAGILAYIIFI